VILFNDIDKLFVDLYSLDKSCKKNVKEVSIAFFLKCFKTYSKTKPKKLTKKPKKKTA